MGGSLAAALRRKHFAGRLAAVDTEAVLQVARDKRLVDETFAREVAGDAIAAADLVVLAMPIGDILEWLERESNKLSAGALVTDVGSTKTRILAAAERFLPTGVHFLGGHPMAGAERGGVENADPFLFESAIYVLTEQRPVPPTLKEEFVELVESIGAKTVFLSAGDHDEIAATVSHLPQLLAVTLMNHAAANNQANRACLKLAAGGFRDMTRIASSPYNVWRDIFESNIDNIEAALDGFVAALQDVKTGLKSGRLAEVFEASATNRLAIPKDTRGFLRPHYDLYVVVQDKPGIIADIANILAKKEINIKDIEVVKVREGDGGTIRLAFEAADERIEAIALLENIGFQTRHED